VRRESQDGTLSATTSPQQLLAVTNPTFIHDDGIHLSDPLHDLRATGITADSVLSELIQQIPSLTGAEALPLSQMITDQLRRWKSPAKLTFRRTKIIEKVSRASVTIIDFECRANVHPYDYTYVSSIVMSDIVDPAGPGSQVSCLWAPAYEGKDTITFAREADHLLSALTTDVTTYNGADRLRTSVVAMSVNCLYTRHFHGWSHAFSFREAAIQRACAWGIVAAKSKEVEYRLFAASLSCFLNSQINMTLQTSDFDASIERNTNDLTLYLVPYFRIFETDLGS
jgi:hypothetical protein